MKGFVRRANRRSIKLIFSIMFVLLYLVVLLPPVYIGISHIHVFIGGLPLTVVYMVGDALLVTFVIWALWWVEKIRQEL